MIDIQEIYDHLNISSPTTAETETLKSIERAMVAYVERQTGRYFGPPLDGAAVVTATHARNLWLPGPLAIPAASAITSVEERRLPGDAATLVTTAAADGYEFRTSGRESWLVRKGAGKWQVGYEYTVTYKQGYKPGLEPRDIRQLVLDLIALKWRTRSSAGLKSETISGYSYTVGDTDADIDAIPTARDTLEAWRRPIIA